MTMNAEAKAKVFIAIQQNEDGLIKVFDARDYQTAAFHTFMQKGHLSKEENNALYFNFPGGHVFKIIKFNRMNLMGDYDRFCVLIKDKEVQQHILSDNENLLKGFVGWRNRIMM